MLLRSLSNHLIIAVYRYEAYPVGILLDFDCPLAPDVSDRVNREDAVPEVFRDSDDAISIERDAVQTLAA